MNTPSAAFTNPCQVPIRSGLAIATPITALGPCSYNICYFDGHAIPLASWQFVVESRSADSRVHLAAGSSRSHWPSRCSARRSRRSLFWTGIGSAGKVFRKKPCLLRPGADLIGAASILRCDSTSEWQGFPCYGPADESEGEKAI